MPPALRVYKGTAIAIKRQSEHLLYSEQFATFGKEEVYNQKDAEGFIRLLSLPERIRAMKQMQT